MARKQQSEIASARSDAVAAQEAMMATLFRQIAEQPVQSPAADAEPAQQSLNPDQLASGFFLPMAQSMLQFIEGAKIRNDPQELATLGSCYQTTASLLERGGRDSEALDHYLLALEHYAAHPPANDHEQLDYQRSMMQCHVRSGWMYLQFGRPLLAKKHLMAAKEIDAGWMPTDTRTWADQWLVIENDLGLAKSDLLAHYPEEALDRLNQCREQLRAIQSIPVDFQADWLALHHQLILAFETGEQIELARSALSDLCVTWNKIQDQQTGDEWTQGQWLIQEWEKISSGTSGASAIWSRHGDHEANHFRSRTMDCLNGNDAIGVPRPNFYRNGLSNIYNLRVSAWTPWKKLRMPEKTLCPASDFLKSVF